MGGSPLDIHPVLISVAPLRSPLVVRPTRVVRYTLHPHTHVLTCLHCSLFFSRPCVEEPRSGCVPQRHKPVVPNPPRYCLFQHIIHVTCHSPFITGLKVITYNIAKSVAACTFSLLDSVALHITSRPLPSLQIRTPCPLLVPLWTISLRFTRHLV